MTKFEQLGVNAQMDATTVEEARQSFNWSCRCCCNRGIHLDCDRCAIQSTHYSTIALLRDTEAETAKPQQSKQKHHGGRYNKRKPMPTNGNMDMAPKQ